MIKKLFFSLLLFTLIIFNSNSMTPEIESLADLLDYPDIFEIMQNQSIASIIASNKKGGHKSAATIEFISHLTQEELSYFESRESYSNNKSNALEVIKNWVKQVIDDSYFLYPREAFPGLSDDAFWVLKEQEIIKREKKQIEVLLGINIFECD